MEGDKLCEVVPQNCDGRWYCEKCDRVMNISSIQNHLKSKIHKGERSKLSDEERLEAQKQTQAKYLAKRFHCESCNLTMLYKCRNSHSHSKAHMRLARVK